MHFRIFFTQDEKIIPIELKKDYEFKLLGYGKSVADGKPMNTYAAHQFRNTADGFEALLQIVFPDCVPVELAKGHQTHLAIEFKIGWKWRIKRSGVDLKPPKRWRPNRQKLLQI